jgi:hypothetical protein
MDSQRTPDLERQFLRHTVATLRYRASKALCGAPEGFTNFRAAEGSRTGGEILAHIGDLFDWANRLAKEGKHEWHDSAAIPWDQATARFFTGLDEFNAHLASNLPLEAPAGKLFQGPIADALTHVGQILLLRRLAGAPVQGENYFRAEI